MRRARIWLLSGLGVVVFLVISALLARALSVDGAERNAITGLVKSEARGDAAGMAALIQGCGASFCPADEPRYPDDPSPVRVRITVTCHNSHDK